jgi:hypothetical protein
MKALIATIAITVLSQASFATSLAPAQTEASGKAQVTVQAEHAEVLIMGKAAELLYKSLDVQAVGSFGLVQSQVKTTDTVECTQAIMGDVPQPGKKLEARYVCTLLVSTK